MHDADTIGKAVRELKCPVNILAGFGSPSILDLQKLGVARVSLGAAPMRASLGFLRRIAAELRSAGTYQSLENAPTYTEINRLLAHQE